MTDGTPMFESPPLVGREAEIAMLRNLLDRAEQNQSTFLFLAGEGGIGKSRLAGLIIEESKRRDWGQVIGRANPVETGVPYALFADALLPGLAELDEGVRTTLTRGALDELYYLFPALAPAGYRGPTLSSGEMGEFKSRVHWNFAELVKRYTARAPLLVVLEDLHWADASSLELLHFVARQVADVRLVIIGTFKPAEMESNPTLRAMVPSLKHQRVAAVRELSPLTQAAMEELVRLVFETDAQVARDFAAHLHRRTGGNPFFARETLKALVSAGQLYRVGTQWMGWDVERFELPVSIRDAILETMRPVSERAQGVAGLAAVLGTRIRLDALIAVSDLAEADLVESLDELCARQVLLETESAGAILYDFAHALIHEALYGESGRARARMLHGLVAQRLEAYYGQSAEEHADELAFHYSRARGGALDRTAARYLAVAGRNALAKYANDEAATYLAAAVERMERDETVETSEVVPLLEDLARARQRIGDYNGALPLWEHIRHTAAEAGDHSGVASTERRLGLAAFWTGRPAAALRQYEAGIDSARRAGDLAMQSRIAVAKGMCLHQLGQPENAIASVEDALRLAEGGEPDLIARVHRALLLLYVWTGPADTARLHGEEAIRLAEASSDRALEFSAHWGMGVLEGLSGNDEALAHRIQRMRSINQAANSPIRSVWLAELEIEYASARGQWPDAITRGEHAISLARSLNQTILLPRLLVWTALIHLARGESERAREYIDEAWTRSGADAASDRPPNLHTVIPAHIGRAALHLADRNYAEAIRVGQAGLAIADRHGYVVWTIHRLVPVIAEALLYNEDVEAARRLGTRLRDDSRKQGHRLGLAWADACDALVAWLEGDLDQGTSLLESAADKLAAIPFVYDAARVRRQFAGRLAELGDVDGSERELLAVHAVFTRLGAIPELEKTRDQFREIGRRPPPRAHRVPGTGRLTPRECQIARLVMLRYSNRRIAVELGIAERTVSTHLSNIYKKLGLSKRGELADWMRTHDGDC
ncbi:MAG TPA: AAA family ATPase [Longimicrobiales bacterium]|nr:AAA family ATPase [Longimicrobiales bacterium]